MLHYRLAAALVAVAFVLGPSGVFAQFGGIFGAPPRPPAGVPNGNRQPIPADPQAPAYPPQQAPGYPPPSSGRVAPPSAVQSQPLPPPPGIAGSDPSSPSQPALSGLPPGQRPPPRGAPQPFDTSPQPGDQIVAEPPTQKIPNTSALFSGLDKITGRIINFDVAIGETVQFGALQVTARACYSRPPTETPLTDGFVEVDEVTLQGEVRRIFTGWMFAASPGLHAVEHAIYDVWLTDCKGGAPVADVQPAPAPAPVSTRPATPAQRQAPQPRPPSSPPAQRQTQAPPQPPGQVGGTWLQPGPPR
jgi:hypothetical protein